MNKIKTTATQKVFCGNNVELLKKYPDNYFDSIVTDPPYGLGKEPNAEKMLSAWINEGYLEVSGSGFMGKEWDAFVPQPIFWKEVFRVLKHGGHVISFFGTRTYDWGVMAMRLAGFEVRDCIQWIYGSGFPKSHNVSKAIDKMQGAEREITGNRISAFGDAEESETEDGRNLWGKTSTKNVELKDKPATEQAKQWDGWGSALKPANEPIVLARKPLEKGLSIAENVLKWGTGAINIDASRIGLSEIDHKDNGRIINRNIREKEDGWGMQDKTADVVEVLKSEGRFPSNVILSHHPDCECLGIKKVKGSSCSPSDVGKGRDGDFTNGIYSAKSSKITVSHTDEKGEELVENWKCHKDCPIKIMDDQSGILNKQAISQTDDKSGWQNSYVGGNGVNAVERKLYLDEGGASRFFYVAKASQQERNFGLNGFEEKQTVGGGGLTAELREDGSLETASAGGKFGSIKALQSNVHPTVKPVKLMQYLVRMITPPNGIVLDPFSGSGTTGIACKIDGFNYVGLELDQDYCDIAQSRIDSYEEEKKLIDECLVYESVKNEIPNQTSIFDFLDE